MIELIISYDEMYDGYIINIAIHIIYIASRMCCIGHSCYCMDLGLLVHFLSRNVTHIFNVMISWS